MSVSAWWVAISWFATKNSIDSCLRIGSANGHKLETVHQMRNLWKTITARQIGGGIDGWIENPCRKCCVYFKHLLFDFPCGAACAAEVCHQDAIEARALRELSSAWFCCGSKPSYYEPGFHIKTAGTPGFVWNWVQHTFDGWSSFFPMKKW